MKKVYLLTEEDLNAAFKLWGEEVSGNPENFEEHDEIEPEGHTETLLSYVNRTKQPEESVQPVDEGVMSWLRDKVSDGFMKMFYYDLKNPDSEYSIEEVKELVASGRLSQEMMKEVFLHHIEKQYSDA